MFLLWFKNYEFNKFTFIKKKKEGGWGKKEENEKKKEGGWEEKEEEK